MNSFPKFPAFPNQASVGGSAVATATPTNLPTVNPPLPIIPRPAAYSEEQRQQESINRYYKFRQGIAEREAQKALSTEGGRSPDTMRGAQAMIESEVMRQAQQGRSPMSNEPISALGMQFQRGSMGQYSPVRSLTTSGGVAPSSGTQPVGGGPQSFGGGGFPDFNTWMKMRYEQQNPIAGIVKAPPSLGGDTDFGAILNPPKPKKIRMSDGKRRGLSDLLGINPEDLDEALEKIKGSQTILTRSRSVGIPSQSVSEMRQLSSGGPQPLGGGSSFGGAPSFGGGGFPSFDEWMRQIQPSTAEIIFGKKAPSKSEAYTDFQLEESRGALREKQKQEEIERNERRAFENPAAKGFYQF